MTAIILGWLVLVFVIIIVGFWMSSFRRPQPQIEHREVGPLHDWSKWERTTDDELKFYHTWSEDKSVPCGTPDTEGRYPQVIVRTAAFRPNSTQHRYCLCCGFCQADEIGDSNQSAEQNGRCDIIWGMKRFDRGVAK